MKRELIKTNGETLTGYEFDSMLEFLHIISNKNPITSSRSSQTGDFIFTGTSSLKEAMDMCRNGYFDRDVENFQYQFIKVTKQINHAIRRTQLKQDFLGFAPNVPLYLAGHPKNMINVDPVERVKKPLPIHLRFNVAISANKSKQTIQKRGLAFLCLFEMLEQFGCDVDLQLSQCAKSNCFHLFYTIPILKKGEPVNISKLYFPLVHPSFLRRLCFAFEERCEDLEDRQYWFGGYGTPEHLSDFFKLKGEEVEDKTCINIYSDDFNFDNDLKQSFKNIVLDLQAKGVINLPKQKLEDFFGELDLSAIYEIASGRKYGWDDERSY